MTRAPVIPLVRYRIAALSRGRFLVRAPGQNARVVRADGTPERIQPVGDGECG